MLEFKQGVTDVDKKDQEKMNTDGDGLDYFNLMKEDFNDSKTGWNKIVEINKPSHSGHMLRRPIPGK